MTDKEIQEYLLNRLAYQHATIMILVSVVEDLSESLGKKTPSFEKIFNDAVKGMHAITTGKEHDGDAGKHDVMITSFDSKLGRLKMNMKENAYVRPPLQEEGNEQD